MTIGLGPLGEDWKPTKSKWRWWFEGKDKDGNITFPNSIIRLEDRPPFPYMAIADENGGKIIPVPGEISITQFQSIEDDDEIVNICKNTVSGTLKLISNEMTIEEWQLEGTKITFDDNNYQEMDENEYLATFNIKYEKSTYINHTKELK